MVVACLVGGALVLTLKGSSSPSAPVAQSSGKQTVAATRPTSSTPPTSTAAAATGATALVNSGAGKCLSGSAGSDGTPLILLACDGSVTQKWISASDGTIRTNGLCMDAAWGGTAAGTVVQIANCSGNPAQHFSLTSNTLYSAQAKMCAGAVNGGTAIQLLPCDQSGAELFKRG